MDDLISTANRNHTRETARYSYFTEVEQVGYLNTDVWDTALGPVTLTETPEFHTPNST
jgi:hypothetical protein